MKDIILYIAVSQDYFIAKKDGNIDWLHHPDYALDGEDFGYADFYASIGNTLMGRKTFEQVDGFDMPFPYAGKNNFVFSSQTPLTTNTDVVFKKDILPFAKQLKSEATEDIWLIGGGAINSILMEADLVDKIILTKIPVELGDGIHICEPLDLLAKYELASSRSYDNGFEQMDLLLK